MKGEGKMTGVSLDDVVLARLTHHIAIIVFLEKRHIPENSAGEGGWVMKNGQSEDLCVSAGKRSKGLSPGRRHLK